MFFTLEDTVVGLHVLVCSVFLVKTLHETVPRPVCLVLCFLVFTSVNTVQAEKVSTGLLLKSVAVLVDKMRCQQIDRHYSST